MTGNKHPRFVTDRGFIPLLRIECCTIAEKEMNESVRREQEAASRSWRMTPKHMRFPSEVSFPFDRVYGACWHLTDAEILEVAEFAESLQARKK